MKKLLPILILSFLFQSCFSYKSVNFNDIKNEKKQKFEVSKLDKTIIKGRLISIDENTMILENKGQKQTILKDEIYDLKVRKFSAWPKRSNPTFVIARSSSNKGALLQYSPIL